MLELMNAQQAAALIDFKLGVDEMTPSMLTYIVFCMAFAVSGYVISPIFTLPGLDKLTMSSSEKKKKNGFAMKGISAASTGALVYMGLGYFNSIPTALAYVAGFTASAVVTFFIKSKGIKWLAPWNMAICMVVGMAAGQMSAMFIG